MKPEGRFLATNAAGLIALAVLLIVTGLVMHVSYRATLVEAYGSVQQFKTDGIWAAIGRFHYWGAQVLLIAGGFQLGLMVWFGWYRKPHVWMWYGIIAIVLCSFVWLVTGNLLPLDRHGVQSAAIEASVAARLPGFGADLRQIMLQGSDFSQTTLDGWYFMHRWILPAIFFLGIFASIVAQAKQNDHKANRVWMLWPVAVAILCAVLWNSPTGPGATANDFDTFLARPNWYAWPIHGSLRLFDSLAPSLGWIGFALIPGLFVVFLVLLPIIGSKAANMLVNVCFLVFILYFGAAAFLSGRDFAPLTGWRDPGTNIVAAEKKNVIQDLNPEKIRNGLRVFDANDCKGCHQVAGKGERVGPILDNVGNRITDRDWLIRFIKNPNALRKGSTMPGYPQLSNSELDNLAEYLLSLNK